MKIFFIGCVEFSKKTLEKLLALEATIVGVATKESSNFNADFSDLSSLCKKNSIPFMYVKDINSQETLAWIKSLMPDVVFCFGWSSLIKKDLLDLPPKGIVGFHPALLPKNRGRHPIIWTLVLGLKETASTFFFMDENADSGDILSQEKIAIHEDDDARSLYDKITETALKQIEKFLPQLASNTFTRYPQNHSLANNWRKRSKKDGEIDWRMSKSAIHDLIRGLTRPYVGAQYIYKEMEIKVWKALPVDPSVYGDIDNIEPGKIMGINPETKEMDVKCSDGVIRLIDHELSSLPSIGDYL